MNLMTIAVLLSQLKLTVAQEETLTRIGTLRVSYGNRMEPGDIIGKLSDAQIAVIGASAVSRIDEQVLTRCPSLKCICTLGVGYDYIDVAKAKSRGITVCNVRGANSESVAEHTWGLILGLAKRIPESHEGVKNGRHGFRHYRAIELYGKTLGIVGFGEIGSRVARIGRSMAMHILSYNRSSKSVAGVSFVDLPTVLREADVVVLTLPLAADTQNLIGTRELEMMKPTALLVNPARAGLIDSEAVLQALKAGKLAGFAMELDINTAPDPRFHMYSNVILTPHTAAFTPEAEQHSLTQALENAVLFARGTPRNIV